MTKKTILPTDSQARKEIPMCSGLLDYFPAALAAVAHVSFIGNEKHNPGQPLHHARGKSMDHADCIIRHLTERGRFDEIDAPTGSYKVRHSALMAWRALALLQEELEQAGAPIARAARFPDQEEAKPNRGDQDPRQLPLPGFPLPGFAPVESATKRAD